ncbi:response regulator transcription factor [Cereibacter sphaeroides]|uniref:response regulator transcription factor n=1 Tax=Cereibacter sphaeroides TaxID=1063 RepID=UPI001F2359C2|nr:response regulator transcription factor [Cereibacter sphaeroides]MCE6957719.1 response regulator transcription factor [Cereibacter sphaeroides]MCE6971505.1 response regulator transcription factor [Cereibacter sphaeroides]
MAESDETGPRILFADGHGLMLDALSHYLASVAGIATVTAADLETALARLRSEDGFDLVLLGLNMSGMHGLAGLRRAKALVGNGPVAILSGTMGQDFIDAAIEAGASGVILKTSGARTVANAIRFMIQGEIYLPRKPQPVLRVLPLEGGEVLSERERRVLALLSNGKANKEIGRDLGISESTVKVHVSSICRKLGAQNRAHAVLIARNHDLL